MSYIENALGMHNTEPKNIQDKILKVFETFSVVKKEMMISDVKSIIETNSDPEIDEKITEEIENLFKSGELVFDEEKQVYMLPKVE